MVYNDSINRRVVADDQMNIYTGHPLETKENRLLVIWYDTSSDVANDGIVSIIIKVKKIFPILGMCIFLC